jgi:hypothetical protein
MTHDFQPDKKSRNEIILDALEAEAKAIVSTPVGLWPRIEAQAKALGLSSHAGLQPLLFRVLLAGLLVALILIAFTLWQPTSPTSAAEIFDRAISVSTKSFNEGEILYERFFVVIPETKGAGGFPQITATAELWQSFDGRLVRYEVVRGDNQLVTFRMRNGEQLWQSIHIDAPLQKEVEAILYISKVEEDITYPLTPQGKLDQPTTLSPFRQSLIYALPEIDRLILAYRPTCAGISCLLQAIDVDEEQLEFRLQNETEEKNSIYTIDIVDPNSPDTVRRLKIDAEEYTFLEYVDQQGSRLCLLEHQIFSEQELPQDLFSSLPEGIRVLSFDDWWQQEPQQEDEMDRLWVVSTEPEPGEPIVGQWIVTIGYELHSRPLSGLYVFIMPYCKDESDACARGTIAGTSTPLAAGAGTVTLRLIPEVWHLKGRMVLMAGFDTSHLYAFEDYVWSMEDE